MNLSHKIYFHRKTTRCDPHSGRQGKKMRHFQGLISHVLQAFIKSCCQIWPRHSKVAVHESSKFNCFGVSFVALYNLSCPLLVDNHCPLVFLSYGVQILALQNPTPPLSRSFIILLCFFHIWCSSYVF
jgi:hypothetical protein